MKKLSTLVLLLITFSVFAQKDTTPTDSFTVNGALKKELKFSLTDIEKYQPKIIDEVSVTNYKNASGSTAKQMKGVLAKDILKGQQYNSQNPKVQSEYTIIFKNAAGSKLVYSWDELFNSSLGDSVYIITSNDGKMLSDMKDRILVISASDLKTEPSFIKNLSEITIQKEN
ncbi:hypothetical protein [Aequorivita capsosiphonis]|uniref:hypothetical protein n=1 Tax=Aequorivita capsosiphonis TaxID=487317 RepID=UPI000428B6BA|nr:hypothetical protein [Aequorivita capsosiphonis]